jgi:hypothetical protein
MTLPPEIRLIIQPRRYEDDLHASTLFIGAQTFTEKRTRTGTNTYSVERYPPIPEMFLRIDLSATHHILIGAPESQEPLPVNDPLYYDVVRVLLIFTLYHVIEFEGLDFGVKLYFHIGWQPFDHFLWQYGIPFTSIINYTDDIRVYSAEFTKEMFEKIRQEYTFLPTRLPDFTVDLPLYHRGIRDPRDF